MLIAQGGEAGGNAGWISTMVLVPAVADVAGEVPVVAARGIADGCGLAAALALGAQGACLGTRFLATTEMTIDAAWKRAIVSAHALDAVKVINSEQIMPPFTLPQPGLPFAPRALRTPLTDQLEHDPAAVDAGQVRAQFLEEVRRGGGQDMLPFTGHQPNWSTTSRPQPTWWPAWSPTPNACSTAQPRRLAPQTEAAGLNHPARHEPGQAPRAPGPAYVRVRPHHQHEHQHRHHQHDGGTGSHQVPLSARGHLT
jgi:hypothetical protein